MIKRERNQTMKKIALSLVFLLGTVLCSALEVTPTYQVFRLKAGAKTTGTLTLTNSEDGELMVTPSVKDFYVLPENKGIKTEDWLRIEGGPFPLKTGESHTVMFTVHPPKKAKGEVAGNLHFATKGAKTGMVSLNLSLAVYAAIEGTQKPKLKIPAVAIQISSDTEVGFFAVNEGNVHLRPRGYIQVFDDKDQLQMNVEINDGHPALPGKPRFYKGLVTNFALPAGQYRADINLEDVDWGFPLPREKRKFLVKLDGTVEAR